MKFNILSKVLFFWLSFFLCILSYAQDPNFHIYLALGQSNMEGNGVIEAQDQGFVDSRFQVMGAVNCTGAKNYTIGKWTTGTPPIVRCNTGLGPSDYFGRTMVANLSSHKRGWDDRWEEFSDVAERGQKYKDELLRLVDEDTRAFNKIMEAFGMPKKTQEEKEARAKAIEEASKYAMEIPFKVMQTAYESVNVMRAMAENGNPNSVSDAGVGALCALTAVEGAFLNVKINAQGIKDKSFTGKLIREGEEILNKTRECRNAIMDVVEQKINEL